MVGIWLNSMDIDGVSVPNNGALSISAGWWCDPAVPLFPTAGGLALSVDLKVKFDGTTPDAASFVKFNALSAIGTTDTS